MKRLILAAAAALTLAGGANAADLRLKQPAPVYTKAPVASTFSWSGLYIDIYGQAGADVDNAVTSMTTTAGTTFSTNLSNLPRGLGFGGEVGYLFQPAGSAWVWGVRAEISALNLSDSASFNVPGALDLTLSNATNYLGNGDLVLGYAVGQTTLLYVDGGLAFGGRKPNLSAAGICVAALTATGCSQAASDTSVGWNIGAGLKHSFADLGAPNAFVFIEGDYSQLGDQSLTLGSPTGPGSLITSSSKYKLFTQQLGLGLKF